MMGTANLTSAVCADGVGNVLDVDGVEMLVWGRLLHENLFVVG